MIAFARLGSVAASVWCRTWKAFTRWRSRELSNRHSPRKRLAPKKRTLSGFEIVSGLTDGAGVMPAKWNRPVFWFRFYEGKISSAFFVLVAPDVPSPPCGKLITPIGAGTASDHHNSYFLSWCRRWAILSKTDRSPVCRDQEKISRERPSSAPGTQQTFGTATARRRQVRGCACAAKDGRKREQRG